MKEITYVTGNKSKILSAKSILEPLNIKSQLHPYVPDLECVILPFVIDLNIIGSFLYSQYANTSTKEAFLFFSLVRSFNIPSSPIFSST